MKSFYWFIALIFPVIMFHEFGHFLMGKALGMNPEVFSIGFGPDLFSFYFWDTRWQISLIPLGGYVQFPEELSQISQVSGNSLKWLIISLMGPLFNFLWAYILIYLYLKPLIKNLTLQKIHPLDSSGVIDLNSTAEDYYLLQINIPSHLKRFYAKNIETFSLIFSLEKNHAIDFNSKTIKLLDLPSQNFYITQNLISENRFSKSALLRKLMASLFFNNSLSPFLTSILRQSSQKETTVKAPEQGILGPIGIARMAHWAGSQSWAKFCLMSASLSISLGFLNLIPLAFLDGGRALQSLIELLSGGGILSSDSFMIYQVISLIIIAFLILFGFFSDIFKR